MATNILMPALSPTMTEGTLARWLKKEGDTVRSGDVIAEIETDKATMEVEAVDEGVLGKILVPDGTEGVKVNAPIAVLVEAGEAVPSGAPSGPAAAKAPAPGGSEAPEPGQSASAAAAEAGVAASGGKVAGAASQPVQAPKPASQPAAAPAPAANGHDKGGERVFASPLARRMAQQAGLDLGGVAGSGPNGRIVKSDIEAALSRGPAPAAQPAAEAPKPAAAPAPAPAPAPKALAPVITAPHTPIPNSSMRKVIARRLAEAKSTIPHFYVAMDIQLDALLKLRADLNARAPKEGPGAFKLSVNDLIIKAAAVTLRRIPKVNASWSDEAILQYQDVDISVAVSIPDGLITPIVRRADQKGLAAISNEMKDLGARAKAGKLKPEEFQGGGFSISNMGMYGVRDFAAIINPPQAGILAVGAGEQRPVVRDGALAIATVMTCTLSVDHRVIDGALAAEWLAAFKVIVEDPLSLML
ncbi:pyruvate dehydrogenase complex dihydrolipoamide acetyltransferase [Roseomonas sp. NAR14]|uniref:Acetyltransferase component of pyruvate dehydrogenase complex n=1 Tax=Roseomonas acroporae TaxID=2937791 RepID=A0A9X1Y5Q9_9PROT|nr:pyruvate dehydrogenase complex dihydrolipoamide acetyltransferase [Roseomonas acroporae]MCK8783550.1 pyruvate dehydrogenase complex dihydrolipoamide acetyltransferase [Roseomonas acroporae]